MSERQVNVPLLRKAVEWAEGEAAKPPELCEWWQGMWVTEPKDFAIETVFGMPKKAPECGTCYCIAGYICEVLGLDTKRGYTEPSAEALGIDGDRAEDLFHGGNTIEDVRRIAEGIAGERL